MEKPANTVTFTTICLEDEGDNTTMRSGHGMHETLKSVICQHSDYISGYRTELLAKVIMEIWEDDDENDVNIMPERLHKPLLAFYTAAEGLVNAIKEMRKHKLSL